MATGRPRKLALLLAAMALAPVGCSQSNPFTSRQTTLGSLKASVSQLEFENEKLQKEVGELKADNSPARQSSSPRRRTTTARSPPGSTTPRT